MPDTIIDDFARSLGVEIVGDMDLDDAKRKHGGFEPIKRKVKELMREGYSASQVLSQVSQNSPSLLGFSSLKKSKTAA